MTHDYEKTIGYKCKHSNCGVIRKTISDIESHIHIAHGLPYEFIIRPTNNINGENE